MIKRCCHHPFDFDGNIQTLDRYGQIRLCGPLDLIVLRVRRAVGQIQLLTKWACEDSSFTLLLHALTHTERRRIIKANKSVSLPYESNVLQRISNYSRAHCDFIQNTHDSESVPTNAVPWNHIMYCQADIAQCRVFPQVAGDNERQRKSC